jgi:hypothetical protein
MGADREDAKIQKEMIFKIVIKEEAYHDLQTAYDYYEEQRHGLGDEFIEEI